MKLILCLSSAVLMTGCAPAAIGSSNSTVARGSSGSIFDVENRKGNEANSHTPWKQLRTGMTTAQVKNLLGEPSEISQGGNSLIWFYENSHVSFRDDGVAIWRELNKKNEVKEREKREAADARIVKLAEENRAWEARRAKEKETQQKKMPINTVSSEYRVISTEDRPPYWCRYSVRLEKRLSEKELSRIAQKLKRSQSHWYKKTLVFFMLPGMQKDGGYWARAVFEPDLKIDIAGMTVKQEKQAIEEPVELSHRSLGRWFNAQPFANSVVEIYRKNGKLIVEHKYKGGVFDGASLADDLIERTVAGQTRYYVRNNGFGEYYVIDSSGNLGICDREGLIITAKQIR